MTAISGMFLDMPVLYARCVIAVLLWQGLTATQKKTQRPIDFLEEADQMIKRSAMLPHPLLEHDGTVETTTS